MASIVDNQVPLPFGGGEGEAYRLKALLFPLLIPVLVFCLLDGVGEGNVLEGKPFER